MDIEALRAFVLAAETGSVTHAAELLRRSPPAVSRRIAGLEASLGVRLLDRTTRSVTPTVVGRDFLPRARRLLDEFEDALLGLRGTAGSRSGQVVIAAVPTVAYYFVPEVIAAFSRRLPGVRVRVHDVSANEVVELVARGAVEFGLGFGAFGHPDADFQRLRADPFVLACRRDHALARSRRVAWADLETHRLVGVTRESGNRLLLDQAMAIHGLRLTWFHEAQHLSTALGFVEAGLGVAVVPRLALPRRRHPVLAIRPLGAPEVERVIGVLRRRGASLAPAAREFHDLLHRRWASREGAGGTEAG